MQGGGHGPAAHNFGIGADQVLEAQVGLLMWLRYVNEFVNGTRSC